MWNHRTLGRIDWRIVPIVVALMLISLLVISATDPAFSFSGGSVHDFFTPKVKSQCERFLIGCGVFVFFAGFDYNKLREWAWILYLLMLVALLGLFFTEPIQNVHRWYRVPFTHMSIQPSEYAKLIVVISLSWFLERMQSSIATFRTALLGLGLGEGGGGGGSSS